MRKLRIGVLILICLLYISITNVFAAYNIGFINDSLGNLVGTGELHGNSDSVSAITTSYIEGATISTRVRFASERDLGAWVRGGTYVQATSSGVSGVINMVESYHKVGSYAVPVIIYF